MIDINTHISNRLQKLLKFKKITQEELSVAINKSKTSINNWITGRNKIDAVSLHLIAYYLNVPISYFFEETDSVPSVRMGEQATPCGECEKYRELLAEKEKTIEDLRFTVDTLKMCVEFERRLQELQKGVNK